MTKDEWSEKAEEKIANYEEIIAEVGNMVGSDYSRNKSNAYRATANIVFLKSGIELLKKENKND